VSESVTGSQSQTPSTHDFMADILVVSGLPDSKSGYWGDVDATIEWCEWNYVVTPYVAEFWNTVSSLVVLCAGQYCSHELLTQLTICPLHLVSTSTKDCTLSTGPANTSTRPPSKF
jgi:hypothetical protein